MKKYLHAHRTYRAFHITPALKVDYREYLGKETRRKLHGYQKRSNFSITLSWLAWYVDLHFSWTVNPHGPLAH